VDETDKARVLFAMKPLDQRLEHYRQRGQVTKPWLEAKRIGRVMDSARDVPAECNQQAEEVVVDDVIASRFYEPFATSMRQMLQVDPGLLSDSQNNQLDHNPTWKPICAGELFLLMTRRWQGLNSSSAREANTTKSDHDSEPNTQTNEHRGRSVYSLGGEHRGANIFQSNPEWQSATTPATRAVLSHRSMSDVEARRALRELESSVRELDVSGNAVRRLSIRAIEPLLDRLEVLVLANCGVRGPTLKHLCKALGQQTTAVALNVLDLSLNNLKGEDCAVSSTNIVCAS
jgi:hypothetical protein